MVYAPRPDDLESIERWLEARTPKERYPNVNEVMRWIKIAAEVSEAKYKHYGSQH